MSPLSVLSFPIGSKLLKREGDRGELGRGMRSSTHRQKTQKPCCPAEIHVANPDSPNPRQAPQAGFLEPFSTFLSPLDRKIRVPGASFVPQPTRPRALIKSAHPYRTSDILFPAVSARHVQVSPLLHQPCRPPPCQADFILVPTKAAASEAPRHFQPCTHLGSAHLVPPMTANDHEGPKIVPNEKLLSRPAPLPEHCLPCMDRAVS